MKNLGERLKLFRKSLDLTQAKFAEPLKITGGNISSIEKGKSSPSEAVFRLMEIHYRINRKYLETGEGEMLVKPKPTTSEPETPYRLGGATTNFTCRNIDFSLLWQAEEILQTDGPLREDLEKTIKELHRQVANYPKNICLPITEKNG